MPPANVSALSAFISISESACLSASTFLSTSKSESLFLLNWNVLHHFEKLTPFFNVVTRIRYSTLCLVFLNISC